MGTIGLLCAMIENQLLSVDDAFKALDRMKSGKRRLPWPEAEKVLNALRLLGSAIGKQALRAWV